MPDAFTRQWNISGCFIRVHWPITLHETEKSQHWMLGRPVPSQAQPFLCNCINKCRYYYSYYRVFIYEAHLNSCRRWIGDCAKLVYYYVLCMEEFCSVWFMLTRVSAILGFLINNIVLVIWFETLVNMHFIKTLCIILRKIR